MIYPRVMSEADTLAAIHSGMSVARYGDGELQLCAGDNSISQRNDPKLRRELCDLLTVPPRKLLPCIPNVNSKTPRARLWREYASPHFVKLYDSQREYGSSFITRPDNAPWIDRPEYWAEVRRLWAGRSVAYVGGQHTLLKVVSADACYVKVFDAPIRDAYSLIDELTRDLLSRPFNAVIIALGAAGTVLAGRLAGAQHALDLGHIGMFMESTGAFALEPSQLATDEYRQLLRHAHATTNWGRAGASWAEAIAKFARKLEAADVLDYGAGGRTLKPALTALGIKCLEYDPGVPGIDVYPKLADVVSSTDVLEHVEPELVDNVLAHIYALARKGAFLVIAKQPAKKILADGRNAHISLHTTEEWVSFLRRAGWKDIRVVNDQWKKVEIHCFK